VEEGGPFEHSIATRSAVICLIVATLLLMIRASLGTHLSVVLSAMGKMNLDLCSVFGLVAFS